MNRIHEAGDELPPGGQRQKRGGVTPGMCRPELWAFDTRNRKASFLGELEIRSKGIHGENATFQKQPRHILIERHDGSQDVMTVRVPAKNLLWLVLRDLHSITRPEVWT